MKITGNTPIRPSGIRRRKDGTEDTGDFQSFLSEEVGTAGVASVGGSAPVASMDAMLSLQEVSEESLQKKKALQHGHQALDQLETLKNALLAGAVPEETLRRLQRTLSDRSFEIDPKLAGILGEIELRVAVELAKLEMAAARRA